MFWDGNGGNRICFSVYFAFHFKNSSQGAFLKAGSSKCSEVSAIFYLRPISGLPSRGTFAAGQHNAVDCRSVATAIHESPSRWNNAESATAFSTLRSGSRPLCALWESGWLNRGRAKASSPGRSSNPERFVSNLEDAPCIVSSVGCTN
jgi:hypothetical protein